jgi:predicted transcriptional regulator
MAYRFENLLRTKHMNTNGNDPYLTAKIVSKYVAHHKLALTDLPSLIAAIHQAIGHLGEPTEPEEVLTPAVSIRRSVHQDYVVCLDCGFRAVTLRRHIRVRHGLRPDEYRQRWGLKANHPLTAPAYSRRRATVAKAVGLGRKPSLETTPVQMSTAASMPVGAEPDAEPAPKKGTRTRPRGRVSETNEAEAAATPRRKGRSRITRSEETASPTAEAQFSQPASGQEPPAEGSVAARSDHDARRRS